MIPEATHQLILKDAINRTIGGVLELGAGYYSTRQIHEWCNGRKIITIDHLQEWNDKFKDLECPTHKFLTIDNNAILKYYQDDIEPWSVVFIDNVSWAIRVPAIEHYRDTAEYLVIHDGSGAAREGDWGKIIRPFTSTDYGWRDFSDSLKYWAEFIPNGWETDSPTTVLGSNKHDLSEIIIPGVIRISYR